MEEQDVLITNDKAWLRRLLPVIVIAIGAAAAVAIVKSRKPPKKARSKPLGTLVETVEARSQSRQITVVGHGTVQPRREVTIIPEVSGRIRYAHPQLVVGGVIKKGQVLLRIDPVDYKLALERMRAQIAQAERGVAEAQSNSQVARREWKILGKRTGRTEPNPLTLGVPQLKQAQAALAGAKAELKQAKVRLSRTVVRAPFNLRVRRESVEVGQYALVGQPLATVYGTDDAEVLVPLKVSELRWIEVPRLVFDKKGKARREGEGSPARMRLKIGNQRHERVGQLERTIGEIDPTGRMTKVVVSLKDPYNLEAGAKKSGRFVPDFEVGAFVEVRIQGHTLRDVIPIPAEALRMGSVVWVVGKGNKLEIRKVKTERITKREALVSSGLKSGDKVIVTPLAAVAPGMKLRLDGEQAKTPAPKKAPISDTERQQGAKASQKQARLTERGQ